MERIFVCNVVPKSKIGFLSVSAAANYFSYNLIDNNIFDRVYSLVPSNISERLEDDNSNIVYLQSSFKSTSLWLKILKTLEINLRLFFVLNRNTKIWYYNLTNQNFILYLLIKIFKPSIKQYIIVLDFTPPRRLFSLQRILKKLIRKSDGIISLKNNPAILTDNSLVLSGLVPENKLKFPKIEKVNYNFILSGILSQNRNPELIFEAFARNPRMTLHITGDVIERKKLDFYLKKYDNINFHGFLKYENYLTLLSNCTFSINSRDPNFKENTFNFPSKTIEHLLYNRIVVSTMEYEELRGVNYFFVNSDLQSFSRFLESLPLRKNSELIEDYANQSEEIIKKFGVSNWRSGINQVEKL